MKPSYALLFAGLPMYSFAYNPFKATSTRSSVINGENYFQLFYELSDESADGAKATDFNSEFNPKELLDSNIRKPELYTNALAELKRLEDHPLCHRLAAQLLMNSCRNIEQSDEPNLQWESQLIQHHVWSFANGLTMCDMESTQLEIPNACASFTNSALHQVILNGKDKLAVSSEQVRECHVALGKDHSHLMIWLDNRNKALLFCRASRLDIDKGIFCPVYE
jgi:hypothetical protein